jgi:hypothetical protein
MYNTIIVLSSTKSALFTRSLSRRENIGIIEASVFPDPVGATRRQFCIREITGIEISCIFVKF